MTRKWIWIESLAWLAGAAAAVFWTSLGFDWSVEPPGWVRGLIGVAAVGGLGWIVSAKLVARLGVPLNDESLAIAVERGHPAFRDSLSTTIALAGVTRADVDDRLFARTVAEAAALLGDVDVTRIFRRRRLITLALLAAAAAATVVLLVAVRPGVGLTWARRMLLLSAAPWPRRTVLDVEGFRGGVRTVARGGAVEIVVHARGSDGPPAQVDLRTRNADGWTTARMGAQGAAVAGAQTFVHVLDGVNGDVDLEIRGGDARLRDLRLHAVDPPAVESLAIRCVPPAYLASGTRVLAAARTIPVPRGSRVEIDSTATKPLRSARLLQRAVGAAESRSTAETVVATLDPAPAGARAISGTLAAVLDDTAVVVRFVDTDGLASRDGVAFTLVAVADESPRVSLRLVGAPTAVTPSGRVAIEGTIRDDHGLAAAAVILRSGGAPLPSGNRAEGPPSAVAPGKAGAVGGPAADAPPVSLPIGSVRGGETTVAIEAADPLLVPIEPLRLAAGGRIFVTAEARDGCTLDGGPNVGTGDTWTLDVVTPEELRALLEAREILLRRRFEGVIEDLSRERRRLGSPVANDAEPMAAAVARCGEAATRAAGETGEIHAAFRGIAVELANNALLSPEIETRLVAGITRPLAAVAAADLPDLADACRRVAGVSPPDPADVGRQADATIARMRQVLATMLEAESVNEIIERLRGVLRTQEQIRAETIETQKRQAREALERP